MLCNRCKKRVAVLFISRIENGKTINEGLCFKCAKEIGIPQVSDMADKMGLTNEDFENMDNHLASMLEEGFQPGGAETMSPIFGDFFGAVPPPEGFPGENTKAKSTSKKAEKKAKYKYLSNYCVNLTERAQEGRLDKVVGRDKEIYRVIQILSRRTKNNPCLIGEPGVGKTAIAEGIAQKIVKRQVPFRLMNKELYLLDMTALIAGTQFRGQFESRVKGLISEVKQAGNIILFIDEVHTLVGTGDSEGSLSAANILKPALSRGEIQVIGATTFDEYRKCIEEDSALERRFQPVTVVEPTMEETVAILRGIKGYYEEHHKVKIPGSILQDIAVLSERYITDRFLPDKAIDLLDEASACRALRSKELSEYEQLNDTLKKTTHSLEELQANTESPDYEKIASAKSEMIRLKDSLKELEPKVSDIRIDYKDLCRVIELWTGIPASKIQQDDIQRLAHLDEELRKKIIGQEEAIAAVSAAIRRNRVQLSKRRRPASFVFVGPTGVGKTELVKVLAHALFDSVDPLIRLDMSEYMEKHAVSRMIGSPPGYVGYDDAGQLTEKVRRRPYSVVLFDEIEKAHPDVMNILLQILDEGKITDAHGRTVNFENTVIVMTSNAGSNDRVGIVGFDKKNEELEKEKAMKGLSKFLRPEFLSRVDEVVPFKPLSDESLTKICHLMLDELKEVLDEKEITLHYDDATTAHLISSAKGGKYGARDLRKEIRRQVEDAIANILVHNAEKTIHSIAVSCNQNKLVFSLDNHETVLYPALSSSRPHS